MTFGITFPSLFTGAFGVDFSSLEEGGVESSVDKVSQGLLHHGVTAYCPTVVTSSGGYYQRVLPLIRTKKGGANGAAVLGIRLQDSPVSL